ncbi:MAG: hypothetical protein QNK37_16425 [Acidobacteriota bacterium]|nr:hypothetical protein [Acidobacteriota bacterium]
MTLLFILIFMGDPIPMKVNVGDPVLDLPVTSLSNGSETNLKELLSEGFCFFLAPSCGYCKKAMPNIKTYMTGMNIIYIFVGEKDEAAAFAKEHIGVQNNVFMVDTELLKPHSIVTFPAVITYKDEKCRVAMHGPMRPKDLDLLLKLYSGAYTKKVVTKKKK